MPLLPVAAGVAPPPTLPAPGPGPSGFGALVEQRAAIAAAPARAGPPRAIATLEGVERAQRRLDAVLAAARAGRTFTAQELLGLQAEAYRAVQTVDLATKIVEQGAQSVKQALNAQV